MLSIGLQRPIVSVNKLEANLSAEYVYCRIQYVFNSLLDDYQRDVDLLILDGDRKRTLLETNKTRRLKIIK